MPRLIILVKPGERFSELRSNLCNKQHFYSKQNGQQNLRLKNVDFQCNSIELMSRDSCNSFDPSSNINILGFQSLFTRAPSTRLHNEGKNHKKNLKIQMR